MSEESILIEGARQNNLKGIDLHLPLGKMIVVTGVSGSGKSSLAFDTIYAEGQRRYVETFSPYTRQFLDRMDRPKADRIEGIPPAIAIDQTNPVRTSRSTVGTMTELNDHIKLLYARAARLYCRGCDKPVERDSPESIWRELRLRDQRDGKGGAGKYLVCFPVTVPDGFPEEEAMQLLAKQGYRRIHVKKGNVIEVTQDRVELSESNRSRIVEDLETALKYGRGQVILYPLHSQRGPYRFSADLHCAECDIHYDDPVPNHFSFNSAIGACERCRGFGRIIDIDFDLVVPDRTKTLMQGAVKPWQTASYGECQEDLLLFARKRGIPIDVPWSEMTDGQKSWVLEGEGRWEDGKWYGVRRFYNWLETKSYKMHIRVLLSKYRIFRECPDCRGARLKPEALLWRLGDGEGYNVHDVMLLPIDRSHQFFKKLKLPGHLDEATEILLNDIRSRLGYLVQIGLGYLTLDRQSRTLSGGEVQRINLTTALGTSLVHTLFVLDEPSIGLHSRDIGRLIDVLHRIRDMGNTLIVVEHDPQVIRAADLVLDMGPGAGERGGEVVFFGGFRELLHCERSLTAQYLTGKKTVFYPDGMKNLKYPQPSAGDPNSPWLEILGAGEHNLKDIDVHIPLDRLVCITGVSGSGKSTLVQDVCFNALQRLKHKSVASPGRHRAIRGHEQITNVVLVDQSPIGKTTRSNPASYVGAFDAIRKLFSAEPLAQERGYTPGTFSFNSGKGRCPTCRGNGFEHIEMQFLSDVYLRCPDCNGKRYRPDVLDVKLLPLNLTSSDRGPVGGVVAHSDEINVKSIADVLEMTVSESCIFFAFAPEVLRMLEPLRAVGLGYLALGQPVPTLSGGEAQRLKLAGHLANRQAHKGHPERTLFLFDEPTTGLHFEDIAILLQAFRQLLQAGHSVVVIEHNLDVIASADWIIDLGPEGGVEGGEVVCAGTPREVMSFKKSYTGRALRDNFKTMRESFTSKADMIGVRTGRSIETSVRYRALRDHSIRIHRAREHNLQNIDVRIPHGRFTVITGVSGSGKSTVAFDIIFAEGQRRYLESLNAYARQLMQPASRPDVDGVFGISPTVAIEQRTSRGGRKSTVATMTEIYHFLRLLFTKLGTQYCPECDVPIQPQTREEILARVLQTYDGKSVELYAPLVTARKGYYTDLAKWASKKGFVYLRVDGILVPTRKWPRLSRFREHSIELPIGSIEVNGDSVSGLRKKIDMALDLGGGIVYAIGRAPEPHTPIVNRGDVQTVGASEVIFSTLRNCPQCGRSFEEPDPRLFSFNSKHGWCPLCYGTGLQLAGFDEKQTGEEVWWTDWWEGPERLCTACNGLRLRSEALAVKFKGYSIIDLTKMTVAEAGDFFPTVKLSEREGEVARDILAEICSRLNFLGQVGLSYLSLDRAAPTLSGGEAQRIRLASQLGSNLRGVCYILDEPTIGLHARDNRMLLDTLSHLKAKGNTVVVVEHDEETIRQAEWIVDLGPGGGKGGGNLVYEGTLKELVRSRSSLTGKYLRKPLSHPLHGMRRLFASGEKNGSEYPQIEIGDPHLHNLKDREVKIPLGKLVCVTGVSGSGKSSLVQEVLYENLRHLLGLKRTESAQFRGCTRIKNWETVERVLEVDQTPIGKTPRSCPATYVGFWNDIRRLFSTIPEAKIRGYGASRFSFNVAGGRCDVCAGQGMKKIKMSFLPDVRVICEACGGKRFTPQTLAVRFKEKNIGDVLAMSVDEAIEFFGFHPKIHHALSLLQDVGLGYLTLGQQSPTLSGGEAQRIKLVSELAKSRLSAHSLYVMDEPTIGLHMGDVEKLIKVLHRLVDAGNTVVIIEHNLDIIAEADWILDLGPEGGDRGGRVVAQGTPEEVSRVKRSSYTAKILDQFLQSRSSPG